MNRETAPETYWIALAGVADIVIGSFGRWQTSLDGTETANGTDGNGVITLILALVALAALWVYWTQPRGVLPVYWQKPRRDTAVGVLVIGLLVLGIGTYELVDIGSYNGPDIVSAGWGLWLVVFGSVPLAISSLDLVRRSVISERLRS